MNGIVNPLASIFFSIYVGENILHGTLTLCVSKICVLKGNPVTLRFREFSMSGQP